MPKQASKKFTEYAGDFPSVFALFHRFISLFILQLDSRNDLRFYKNHLVISMGELRSVQKETKSATSLRLGSHTLNLLFPLGPLFLLPSPGQPCRCEVLTMSSTCLILCAWTWGHCYSFFNSAPDLSVAWTNGTFSEMVRKEQGYEYLQTWRQVIITMCKKYLLLNQYNCPFYFPLSFLLLFLSLFFWPYFYCGHFWEMFINMFKNFMMCTWHILTKMYIPLLSKGNTL